MKKEKPEIHLASSGTGKTWLILFFLYVLVLVWLEPLIDFLLSLNPPQNDFAEIAKFNARKLYIATVAFSIGRSLPIILFVWLGYLVILGARLPPKNMRLPVSVRVTKGQNAKMMGMFMIALSLLLLLREVYILANA